MEERPFMDPRQKPTEELLQSALGKSYAGYTALMDMVKSREREWTFSTKSGWALKVSDPKKALFYLTPLTNTLRIALTVREQERAALLSDNDLEDMHIELASAKKYPEGFALQFAVANDPEHAQFAAFLTKLIALRK
jgi:Protein of unknown function (DUF3788)